MKNFRLLVVLLVLIATLSSCSNTEDRVYTARDLKGRELFIHSKETGYIEKMYVKGDTVLVPIRPRGNERWINGDGDNSVDSYLEKRYSDFMKVVIIK